MDGAPTMQSDGKREITDGTVNPVIKHSFNNNINREIVKPHNTDLIQRITVT